jgi:hypothetical protein
MADVQNSKVDEKLQSVQGHEILCADIYIYIYIYIYFEKMNNSKSGHFYEKRTNTATG